MTTLSQPVLVVHGDTDPFGGLVRDVQTADDPTGDRHRGTG